MEVSFPEDWPESETDLRRLDRSMRCNICRDFLEGPVALTCGHACEQHVEGAGWCLLLAGFVRLDPGLTLPYLHHKKTAPAVCSQCIRSNLDFKSTNQQKTTCPECRAPADTADLRPVIALREACVAFGRCRGALLDAWAARVRAAELEEQLAQLQAEQQQQQGQKDQQQARPQRREKRKAGGAALTRKRSRDAVDASAAAAPPAAADAPAQSRAQRASSRRGSSSKAGGGAEKLQQDGEADADAEVDEAQEQEQQQGQQEQPRRLRRRSLPTAPDSTGTDLDNADADSHQASSDSGGSEWRLSDANEDEDEEEWGGGAEGGGGGDQQQRQRDGRQADASGSDVEVVEIDMDSGDFESEPQQAAAGKRGKENRRQPPASGQKRPPAGAARPGAQQQKPEGQPPQQLPSNCVACPICGMSIKAGLINAHLDTCLSKASSGSQPASAAHNHNHQQQHAAPSNGAAKGQPIRLHKGPAAAAAVAAVAAVAAAPAAPAPQAFTLAVARPPQRALPPLEPPTKLCFAMMKDRDLKKKLVDLGLSADGTKQVGTCCFAGVPRIASVCLCPPLPRVR
jgi:hypothetical protein